MGQIGGCDAAEKVLEVLCEVTLRWCWIKEQVKRRGKVLQAEGTAYPRQREQRSQFIFTLMSGRSKQRFQKWRLEGGENNETPLGKMLFCTLMQRMAGPRTCYTSRPRQHHHRRREQQSDRRHSTEVQPKSLALASAENLRRWERPSWVFFIVALMKVPMLLNS